MSSTSRVTFHLPIQPPEQILYKRSHKKWKPFRKSMLDLLSLGLNLV